MIVMMEDGFRSSISVSDSAPWREDLAPTAGGVCTSLCTANLIKMMDEPSQLN